MINKEQTDINNLISKKEFSKLANFHDQHCISIYIPTSGQAKKLTADQGQITIKKQLKKLKTYIKGI